MTEPATGDGVSGDARARDRRSLRREARAARAALSPAERRRAAQAICRHLTTALRAEGLLAPGKRIAVYLAVRGELDLEGFMARARAQHCRLFLPRVTDRRQGRMTFSPAGPQLRRGAFGIPEPAGHGRCAAQWLQVVLLPVVGFDGVGNRLGSGAGFYDRALAFRGLRRRWRGPRLIGVAHSCQRLPSLPTLPTDVPLDAVVTEQGFFSLPGGPR
jgi:5-formyltetrahydrofolate cyclo-ligase